MNRPAMNWLTPAETEMTVGPMLMIKLPMNMPTARPRRTLEVGKVKCRTRAEANHRIAVIGPIIGLEHNLV
jgi:hypothetical protein